MIQLIFEPFNPEILEYILSLNKDLERSNYNIHYICLSDSRDESGVPFSTWDLSIEDLDNSRTASELKTSLERILNTNKEK